MKQPLPQDQLNTNRINFYMFITEYCRRRNTQFLKTFPELTWMIDQH